MQTGTRLGIDVGKARIGVARSDPHGMLATPVETVKRDSAGDADLVRLEAILIELDAREVVVGLPLNLRGEVTASTDDAERFARRLAERIAPHGATVRMVDERLSTVSAQGQLHQAGRNTRNSRAIIDQAAAVVILQHALDIERSRGSLIGVEVDVTSQGREDIDG
ncbi:MAG: Holliday junction resolvase RuvX [Leucobacter sp.]